MNRFIRKSLEPGEEIVYNGRLHWSYVFGYTFWSAVLIVGAVALAVYGLLQDEASRYLYYTATILTVVGVVVYLVGRVVRTRSEFVVTRTRFIQKDGILDISMTEIPLFKVETVNYHQTLFQRLIGTGCIELVGSGGTCHQLHCVDSPMDVRRAIVAAINQSNQSEAQPATEASPVPRTVAEAAAAVVETLVEEEKESKES